MAIKVKSPQQSQDKWVRNAQNASQEYATNAEQAGDTWQTRTAAAEGNYAQAVSNPTIQRRFGAGVRKAGAQKYQRGITEKGAQRYGPGVATGGPDYNQGVTPYLDTIAALTLQPRRPRGDPGNYQRVSQIGDALHNKRIALLGGA